MNWCWFPNRRFHTGLCKSIRHRPPRKTQSETFSLRCKEQHVPLDWRLLVQASPTRAINGAKSEWIPVNSGVPQGTVLGPTLFNIFINDITDNINSEIRLFADDYVCYRQIRHKEDHNILQRDVEHLGNWAKRWNMRFEPTKSKIMHITRKTRHKLVPLPVLPAEHSHRIRHAHEVPRRDCHQRPNRMLGLLIRNMSACDPAVKEAAYMGLVSPSRNTPAAPGTPTPNSSSPKLKRSSAGQHVSSCLTSKATNLAPWPGCCRNLVGCPYRSVDKWSVPPQQRSKQPGCPPIPWLAKEAYPQDQTHAFRTLRNPPS